MREFYENISAVAALKKKKKKMGYDGTDIRTTIIFFIK